LIRQSIEPKRRPATAAVFIKADFIQMESQFVMARHSLSKNGVASLAYVPAIHVLLADSQ